MIIQRYIIKETLYTWAAVTLILSLIFAVGIFVRFLTAAAGGSFQMNVAFYYLALKYISSTTILLPLTLYIAIIIGLGRLYNDSEMTAIAACGMGVSSILAIVSKLSIFVCLALMAISLYAAPWAEHQILEMKAQSKADTNLSMISSGRFTEIKNADLIFYTEQISKSGKELENLFVQRTQMGNSQLLTAEKAYMDIDEATGDNYLVFENGYSYEGVPGEANYKIVQYKNYAVRIPPPKINTPLKNVRTSARPTNKIWKSENLSDKAEFQWRLALPVSAILLPLLAVLLSHSNPRQGRFAKLFIAILLYLIYNNVLGMAETWYEKQLTPSYFGIWWVNFLLLSLILILWIRQLGVIWVISRFQKRAAH